MEWIVGYMNKKPKYFVFYDSYDSEEKAQKIAFALNGTGEEVWKSYCPTLTGPEQIHFHSCSRETLFEAMDSVGYPPKETKKSLDMDHKDVVATIMFNAGKEYRMEPAKYIYGKYGGNH